MIDTARRLEEVREVMGFPSLRSFHAELAKGWTKADGKVSYEAARNYHYDREAPVSYLSRVAEVFGIRVEWLVGHGGERTEEEERLKAITAPERAEIEDSLSNVGSSVYAALHEELPRLATGLLRTNTRLVAMMEQVIGRLDFLSRHHELMRSVLFDKDLSGAERDRALERRTKEAAIREVARAVRGPADAFGVDIEAMNEDHFALYVDAISTATAVLLMEPRRYLGTEDRQRLPATQATLKASEGEQTDA